MLFFVCVLCVVLTVFFFLFCHTPSTSTTALSILLFPPFFDFILVCVRLDVFSIFLLSLLCSVFLFCFVVIFLSRNVLSVFHTCLSLFFFFCVLYLYHLY